MQRTCCYNLTVYAIIFNVNILVELNFMKQNRTFENPTNT